jgi:protoporphyrinogen oxidase
MNCSDVVILGGGLSGLAAGCVLTRQGCRVRVFEGGQTVGGLARTVERNGFRFDLGGHRFITSDAVVDAFVRSLMGNELLSVQRSSKIYMRGRYFDYPLKPLNAIFGLGIPTTAKIIADYAWESARALVKKRPAVSLEDWIVANFGRTMFTLYFQQYSEKIWGMESGRISAEWVAQRIRGLSLMKAMKNAFFKFNGRDVPTLVDHFLYPRSGIGRIAERLREEIELRNEVNTGRTIVKIRHSGHAIDSVVVQHEAGDREEVQGAEFLSTLPLTQLVRGLDPAPPSMILNVASRLRFRDLVIVAIMLDRERATDQTWIYVPERHIPFGRIHEPTNWSRGMAPDGKTLLVTEFFSFRGDAVWEEKDEVLAETAAVHLERLGFIKRYEVIDAAVVRVANAYPLFEIGYRQLSSTLLEYLDRFRNLHIAGRSGLFLYHNMDGAIRSGIDTAERIAGGPSAVPDDGSTNIMTVSR